MDRRTFLALPAIVGLSTPITAQFGTKPTPPMDPRYMTAVEAAYFVADRVRAYDSAFAGPPTEPSRDGWKGMCAFGCYSSHPDRLWRADVEEVARCILAALDTYGINGWGLLELPHGLIRTGQVGPLRVSQVYDVLIDEVVTRFDMGTCRDGVRVTAGGPALVVVRGKVSA